MKNYSDITESLDITTKQYVDQGLSSKADISDLAQVAISGSYNDLTDKPTAIESVLDYGDINKKIKIGYSGVGIAGDSIKYIAGFTAGDSGSVARIKNINQDAMKAWLGYATVAKTGSYNDLVDKPTIPDISGKANLAGNNTFTGGQTITGSIDGYSINASGYVKGSWLQSSVKSNKGSNTGMVCVFDSAGWIYYRTPSEILSEAGGVTMHVEGDTLYLNT